MKERKIRVQKYLNANRNNPIEVETPLHVNYLSGKLPEMMKIYNPSVVLKIGISSFQLIESIVDNCKRLILIEPSLEVLKNFREEYSGSPILDKIYLINSEFENIAVDYNVIDMLICSDYLDIIESAPAMTEFSRVIDFHGVLLFAGVVLNDEDIDGIFDDLFRELNPLHNDYYLEQDLDTYMKLKNLLFVQKDRVELDCSINKKIHFLQSTSESGSGFNVDNYISENKEVLQKMYSFNNEGFYKEHYLLSVFRKQIPEQPDPDHLI